MRWGQVRLRSSVRTWLRFCQHAVAGQRLCWLWGRQRLPSRCEACWCHISLLKSANEIELVEQIHAESELCIMLPQSFWAVAWSTANRFIVLLDHSSHHQLPPGVSAVWVLPLTGSVGHRSSCSPCSGLGEWPQSLKVSGDCSQSPLRHSIRAVSCTHQSGRALTAAMHLTDRGFGQKLPSGAGSPVRQPLPCHQPFAYGSPLARLRYQNWQNCYQKCKRYFRPEVFLSSFIHLKIKLSYMRWPKQLLKLVYPWHDLLQLIFAVPCRWSSMLAKLKVAWDQPWNSQS